MDTDRKNTGGHEPRPPGFEIKAGLLARNTILNMVGLGLPMVIGVVAIPFIVRWLGTERFGILSLVWVVVGYFAFFDLGLSRATTKFIAEALGKGDPEKIPGILWTTVFFQGIFGLLGAVILALSTPLLVERILHIQPAFVREARFSFILIGISLPVVLVSASFRGALEARQRFDMVNLVKGISSAFNYLLPLAGVGLGYDLRGIVVLLVGARILTLAAWIWMCLRALPVLKKRVAVRGENIPLLLKFGGWLTVSNIVRPVLLYLDRFLIGSIMTMQAVGFYVAPYEVVTKVGILPGSLILTLFPSFSAFQGREEHGRLKTLFSYAVKYLIIGIGPVSILMIFLAGPVLNVWLGAEFAKNSTLVFQILALGFLTNSLADIPLALLQGIGRPDLTAKIHIIELIIFAPVGWFFILRWGINGAAAAWTLRVTVEMTVMFVAAWKVGNMKFTARELLQSRIPQGIFALALFGLGGTLLQHYYGKPLGLLAPLVGFLALCGFFVLGKKEISWLRAGLPRFLGGLHT